MAGPIMWCAVRATPAAVLVVAAWTCVAQAQLTPDETTQTALRTRAQQFLDSIGRTDVVPTANDIRAAYEALIKNGPLSRDHATEVRNAMVEKTHRLRIDHGAPRGTLLVSSRAVGSNLILMKYLQEFEQFPVVWYFTFYRIGPQPTGDTWAVIAVRFDTQLEQLALEPRSAP
jgi:hypothetical protein